MKNLIVLFAACCALTLVKASIYEAPDQSMSNQLSDESGRVINGRRGTRGQFPHQAIVYTRFKANSWTWCAGALISDRWVLTNPVCALADRRILVHVGVLLNIGVVEEGRVIRNASRAIIHPHYNQRFRLNDIALLGLDVPVEFSETIRPIQLPEPGKYYHDIWALASGFGTEESDVLASNLHWAKFKTINNVECAAIFGNSESLYVARRSIICAVGRRAASSCIGDRGGPLITEDRVLIGLVSFISDRGCDQGFPVGYTRVNYYLDWIASVTGK